MKRPDLWLLIVALLMVLVTLDAWRPPQEQMTAKLYIGTVGFYQREIHPITSHFIRCHYNPTCSHYSVQAVERFGIGKGLFLTTKRLISCNRSVPMGTVDAVPAR